MFVTTLKYIGIVGFICSSISIAYYISKETKVNDPIRTLCILPESQWNQQDAQRSFRVISPQYHPDKLRDQFNPDIWHKIRVAKASMSSSFARNTWIKRRKKATWFQKIRIYLIDTILSNPILCRQTITWSISAKFFFVFFILNIPFIMILQALFIYQIIDLILLCIKGIYSVFDMIYKLI